MKTFKQFLEAVKRPHMIRMEDKDFKKLPKEYKEYMKIKGHYILGGPKSIWYDIEPGQYSISKDMPEYLLTSLIKHLDKHKILYNYFTY